MQAERLPNGDVKLSGAAWFDVFPEADRERWTAFYDRMHRDYGYDGYKVTADNLRALSA